MNGIKVVQVHWFGHFYAQDKCMGIVKAQDETTGEFKFYIGFGLGEDEQADIREIIEWGTKYSHEEFKNIYASFLEIEK